MAKPKVSTHKWFGKERVNVNFASQASPVQVIKLDTPRLEDLKPVPADFHPKSLVINIKVVAASSESKVVTRFNPPLTLRVHYTAADVKKAGEYTKLKFGYWDGKKWTLCTARLVPGTDPAGAGVAIIKISGWDDPTIAIGT